MVSRTVVSIPFSSGRERSLWETLSSGGGYLPSFNPLLIGAGALPWLTMPIGLSTVRSFNPLLIGAGALPENLHGSSRDGSKFQSPSHRGGSAPRSIGYGDAIRVLVSIPFSSGREGSPRDFVAVLGDFGFQSPSHRGGSAPHRYFTGPPRRASVSIPFSSGRERS